MNKLGFYLIAISIICGTILMIVDRFLFKSAIKRMKRNLQAKNIPAIKAKQALQKANDELQPQIARFKHLDVYLINILGSFVLWFIWQNIIGNIPLVAVYFTMLLMQFIECFLYDIIFDRQAFLK